MRLKRNLSLMLALWLALSTSSIAKADRSQDLLNQCKIVLTEGQEALDAKNKELSLCNLGLTQSQNNVAQLNTELENKNAQLSAFYRNPFFMLAIGILAGVALTR